MRHALDLLLRGRHFYWITGTLAVLLWVLLIRYRPAFYVEQGSLLCAIAAVIGGLFLILIADKTAWTRSYLIAICIAQLVFGGLCAGGVVLSGSPVPRSLWALLAFIVSQVILCLLIAEERGDSTPQPAFKPTKQFYEVYWVVVAIFGVTCDVLDHLRH